MSESQNRREFIKGSLAASAVVIVPSSLGCSEGEEDKAVVVPEWQEIADGLESSNQCCWTAAEPSADPAASAANHAPLVVVSRTGEVEVTLEAGHPMLATHWITTLYVRDQDNVVIGLRDFGQIALKPQFSRGQIPELRFPVPLGTSRVQAFSYCNLHDHWASEAEDL